MPSLVFKQVLIAGLSFLLLIALIIVGYLESVKRIPGAKPRIVVSKDSAKCVDCHEQPSNARTAVLQWRESKHAQKGVGCLECHVAEADDLDAFDHYTYTIATVVSPKDCSRCYRPVPGQPPRQGRADPRIIGQCPSRDRRGTHAARTWAAPQQSRGRQWMPPVPWLRDTDHEG